MKQRIAYIDALRGVVMLLVILSHLYVLCMGYEEQPPYLKALWQFVMPMFFCISGFFTYRAGEEPTWQETLAGLGGKVRTLLIPTLFFLTLYMLLFHQSFILNVLSPMKGGYWFTYALFEMALLSSLARYVCKSRDILLFAILGGMAMLIFVADKCYPQHDVTQALGLHTLHGFIYFILGMMMRKYYARLEVLFAREWATALLLLITLFFSLYMMHHELPHGAIAFRCIGLVALFALFQRRDQCFSQTWVGKQLSYVGRNTLGIYLMHYFFLPRHLEGLGTYLRSLDCAPVEFAAAACLVILTATLCLVTIWIMRSSSLLDYYLLGGRKSS